MRRFWIVLSHWLWCVCTDLHRQTHYRAFCPHQNIRKTPRRCSQHRTGISSSSAHSSLYTLLFDLGLSASPEDCRGCGRVGLFTNVLDCICTMMSYVCLFTCTVQCKACVHMLVCVHLFCLRWGFSAVIEGYYCHLLSHKRVSSDFYSASSCWF